MLAHAAMMSSRIVNDTVDDNYSIDDDDDINGPLLPNDIRYSVNTQHHHPQRISDSQVPLLCSSTCLQ
jgi:hypothetical protein